MRHAQRKGVLTFKFSSPSHRGVPDRIFIKNGFILFLEVKRPGGVPTRLQEYTMRAIRQAGARVNWVDNVQDGKDLIDGLDAVGGCGCLQQLL